MKKIVLLLLCLLMSMRVMAVTSAPTFALAVLPDTQKYSKYDVEKFSAQTQWIADHTASHNIVFTTHLGDLVDISREEYQWQNADAALSILENHHLPYSVLAGNHDLLDARQNDAQRNNRREPFLRYFPAERFQDNPTYGGHSPSGFNSYYIFEALGQPFLVLALDWRVSDESLQWVQSVLDAHAEIPTILTTHDLLNRYSEPQLTRNGSRLWDAIIAPNNQIFLTINGHLHGQRHVIMQNDAGNDVLLMVVDYQGGYMGGNGMMRLLTFDLAHGTISAESFSPYVMAIPPDERDERDIERRTDAVNQFTVELNILERGLNGG